MLQDYPYALYTQEILNQEWSDLYKNFSADDVEHLLSRHKRRLLAAEQLPAVEDHPAEPAPVHPLRPRRTYFLYVAAVAVGAIIMLGVWNWWSKQPAAPVLVEEQRPPLQQLVTQKGARTQLLLPDGTKVWLNAGSKLDYPARFDGPSRDVTLEGEAFFEVTRDPGQPFLVHTSTFNIKVIGTAFNVRVYADEESAETSLINGAVEVHLSKDQSTSRRVVFLRPNEKLTIPTPLKSGLVADTAVALKRPATPVVTVAKAALTRLEDRDRTILETAWVNDKLAFRNTSLEKIAYSLEKWFNVEIRFRNADKKTLKLTGTFEGESLDEILRAFQMTGKRFKYGRAQSGVLWIE